ncbi:acyl-coenzyme A thioesterase 1/2/4 [Tenacibaculum sp. 190524A05c]|uniref:alpha/beta hydrolase family protein n=1 Tax=Tenacibaculum platacis TaxID=3137852 RepID=UPI0031FA77AE
MRKKIKILVIVFVSLLVFALLFLFTHVPKLSDKHGIVEAKLYLGNSENQPLFVGFGGGGGGNDWTRTYLKQKRDSLNNRGFAVLAIGYFNANGTPKNLDRISLDAIKDTILSIANHPKIDNSKIILFGGSRGGELVLNLASRYQEFNGVIAASTSHVSFPAITIYANTSSWTYKGQEVPYVPAPLKTISPAIKGDLYTAHSMMLEDKEAVKNAEIEVENIKGPVLIISGKKDDQWPASQMSEQIMKRLRKHNFKHYYHHVQLNGGHVAPLKNFNVVYEFLDNHFKSK